MPTKRYKPMTPGHRNKRSNDFVDLTSNKPHKPLTKKITKSSGRNNYGNITVRHHGGGVKRRYRAIDFMRNSSVEGVIESIEYDPNRSSYISLVKYVSGQKSYILTPKGIKLGDRISKFEDLDISIGNSLKLYNIPVGSFIHNIQLHPNKSAQIVRSAGCYALLMAKSSRYATVKLPSGEIRLFNIECQATYGRLANESHNNLRRGKAGITRKLNKRPTVRGAVMNPCDHRHGGGEGRAPVGLSEPRSIYGGKVNKKTRSDRKSKKHIVKARKR